MHLSLSPLDLVTLVAGALALVAFVVAFRMRAAAKHSRIGIAVAALPPVVMLALFYSLAVHMHHALGGWPASIGEEGFPPPLITHGHIAWDYSAVLFLLSIFVWPVVLLLCLFIPRARFLVYYLAVYAASFVVCLASMWLAPSSFLNWWWD